MSINFEKDLNKQQFAAVTSTAKHLRIVAGAGTGKTRVLTYRLAYLISERHIAPKRIVAITFTNKVAAEMKERVYNLLTDSERMLGSPLISTFHGFCYRFLSREITHMQGFTNKFQIADEDVQNDIFKSFAEKLGYKMKSPYMSLLVGTIRNLKTKGVFVDQISNSDVPLAAPFTFKVLEEVYSGYQEKLKQSNLLDFDEVNLFLRGIVPMVGFQSTTVEYERGERFAGESKYPLGKMVTFAFEGITSLSVKPIRMITIGGLLICLISLIMLIKSFVDYFNGNVVPGWASIMVSIWVLGGLQIFAIGIIGEYIGKTYLETKKRPKYIIESVILDDKDISIDRNL